MCKNKSETTYKSRTQPVLSGVGVEQTHVVHQLMRDDAHGVRVSGVEAGKDPHPTWQSWQWTWPYVGVGAIECTTVTSTTAFSRKIIGKRNIIKGFS